MDYSVLTSFYNCRSEEPESWAWGRKVMTILDDAKIDYELWTNEDDWYETSIKVPSKYYSKAKKLINKK